MQSRHCNSAGIASGGAVGAGDLVGTVDVVAAALGGVAAWVEMLFLGPVAILFGAGVVRSDVWSAIANLNLRSASICSAVCRIAETVHCS